MLNYIIWDWNPEIFNLGFLKDTPILSLISGLSVRYYGLLFAGGFAIGYYLLKKVFLKEGTKLEWLDSMLMYVLVGTVVGARLGHCLFYEPQYYLRHPIDILKVWEGGLASHGGAFGILIALWLYSKKVTKKSIMWSLDRLLLVVALAGAMIRIGNLANSEIYGHPTNSDYGIVYVHDTYLSRFIHNENMARYIEDYNFVKEKATDGKQKATLNIEFNKYVKDEQSARTLGDFRIKPRLKYHKNQDGSLPNLYIEDNSSITYEKKGGHYIASIPLTVVPKHPTHLYEAACYLTTFFLLLIVYYRGGLKRTGLIFGLWCIGVFGSRFFIEMIKENQVASEVGMLLNKGQKLSIPFILAGIIGVVYSFLPQKDKQ